MQFSVGRHCSGFGTYRGLPRVRQHAAGYQAEFSRRRGSFVRPRQGSLALASLTASSEWRARSSCLRRVTQLPQIRDCLRMYIRSEYPFTFTASCKNDIRGCRDAGIREGFFLVVGSLSTSTQEATGARVWFIAWVLGERPFRFLPCCCATGILPHPAGRDKEAATDPPTARPWSNGPRVDLSGVMLARRLDKSRWKAGSGDSAL